MKKKYIAPNINITEVKASQIICASNGALSTNNEDAITDSESFGSRRFSIWDDEEVND